MKTLNKITAFLCCFALTFPMVSCSDDTVVLEQNKQVNLTFSWWGNDSRNKYTIKAIEKFEDLHPEINVECRYSEWSGYETRNNVEMISNTEADVMQINFGWLSQYSENGNGYYDINSLKNFRIENFSDDYLYYGIKNDKLNAIPIAMNTQTVYINKTIYDSYGLPVPKTWEDFINSASVMRNDGVYPLSAPSKAMWLYLITYAEQVTGKSILDENKNLNFNAEDFKTMIQFYKLLVEEKVLPQIEYYKRTDFDNGIYAGCVAWVSDAENYFGSAVESGQEVVIADYTTISGENVGEGWYAKPATMYAVSKNTEHPDEAGLLLDYLLNSPEMAQLQGIEKGIPLSSSAKSTIEKSGMLEGLQYQAAIKMEGVPMKELDSVLENTSLIDDFFTVCKDVIFEMTTIDEGVQTFYEKAVSEYFS